MRWLTFSAAWLAISGHAGFSAAQARERQVVALVDPGDTLLGAVRSALEPWNLEIVVVSDASPGATAPHAITAAREIARAHRAAAVAWLSEQHGQFALWMYDVAGDHAVTRSLSSPPPFDSANAAAVALSMKTLLRHSTTAPEAERFGGLEKVAGAAQPRAAPQPDDSQFDLEGRAGLRLGHTHPTKYEPLLGLGVAWWPNAQWFGLALEVATGPGVPVSDGDFQGRLIDSEVRLGARLRQRFAEAWQMSVNAGASLQITLIDGTLSPQAQYVQSLRLAPAAYLELEAAFRIDRWLRLGLRAGIVSLFRTRRYWVEGQPVLELSPWAFESALVVAVSLPD
jgi:hypothetical protein